MSAPTTLVALAVLVVAVLPGGVYTWGFERQAGPFGVTFTDRVLRFLGVSLVFHLLLAWPEYALYRVLAGRWDGRAQLPVAEFALLWGGLVVITAVPFVTGAVIGSLYATRTTRQGWSRLRRGWLTAARETTLLRLAVGPAPAPRAWDDVFSDRPAAYLRVRMEDGTFIAGRFAADSYAAGFPNDPDLYLEEAWDVDQRTGALLGDTGLGFPTYVRAGTFTTVDVLPEQSGEEPSSGHT